MKTFKNTNHTTRSYEATNIVFCETEKAPNENWVECSPEENTLEQLWIETANGQTVRYFGHL